MITRAMATAMLLVGSVLPASNGPQPAEPTSSPPAQAAARSDLRLEVARTDSPVPRTITDLGSGGCSVETLGLLQEGRWLLYVQGAPAAVNAAFPSTFVAGTPYLVRCRATTAGAAAPPPVAAAPTSLPTWGVFDTGWPPDSTVMADTTRALGRPPGIVSWYVHAASTDPPGALGARRWDDNADRVRSVLAAGQAPMITWEMWRDATPGSNPMPLASIAAGTYDDYFDSWAAGVRSVAPGVVYLRIFHEMNLTGQYPWSVYKGDRFHNTPAQLTAAWRHIVDRFRAAGVTNVRWVFNPGGDLSNNPLPAGAYPGDDYVDYIGLDVYDTSPPGSLALDYPLLSAIADKPWIFGEVGGTPRWVTGELGPFMRRRPMTIVWFNAGQWELERTRLAALQEALAGLP
ncbi:MAG: glycosyl hydrolase [Dehalococcoidia bacterium]